MLYQRLAEAFPQNHSAAAESPSGLYETRSHTDTHAGGPLPCDTDRTIGVSRLGSPLDQQCLSFLAGGVVD